jgi:hypothetical protein
VRLRLSTSRGESFHSRALSGIVPWIPSDCMGRGGAPRDSPSPARGRGVGVRAVGGHGAARGPSSGASRNLLPQEREKGFLGAGGCGSGALRGVAGAALF